MTGVALLGPDGLAVREALAALRRAPAAAPATFAFLGACLVLFVVAEGQGSTEDVDLLVRFGATERGRVQAGEAWRLVTAAFLHVGVAHLAWNVVTMPAWCVPVERAVGTPRFAAVYAGAAIAASATSLLAHGAVSAGASGPLYAMISARLVLARRRAGSWRGFLADRKVEVLVFLSLLWTLGTAGDPGIDHAGHVGGFAAGAVLAWAATAPARGSGPLRRWPWAAAALAVVVPAALAIAPRPGAAIAAAEREVFEAFGRAEPGAAERALARAADAGLASPRLEYARALLLQRSGDLAAATRAFDALATSHDAEIARHASIAAKTLLGVRLLAGDGVAPDPARGRRLLQEACAEGGADVCAVLDEERPEPSAAK